MIYISLTTVPIRISTWDQFQQNINSLLNQKTSHNYKVVLNIPYHYKNNNDEEYIIPEELKQLASENSKLTINRVNVDFGPVVKITGVLEVSKDDNDILIVCDDDHVYHEDMIEYHLHGLEKYPNCATAFRGDLIIEKREWKENNVEKYTLNSTHVYFPVKNDSQLIIPGHWHSVGYRRNFFKEDFLSKEILLSSDNDDVIVGYYLKKNNIHIRCLAYDKETDWRPVNDNGRNSYTFPIVESLSFPSSGFSEFRIKHGDHMGRTEQYVWDLIHDHSKIYINE